jgi:hypothetical protein
MPVTKIKGKQIADATANDGIVDAQIKDGAAIAPSKVNGLESFMNQEVAFYYDGTVGSSSQWNITHNLNQDLVTIMIKDTVHPQNSYMAQQIADVTYVNATTVRLDFQAPFSGYAYIYK